MHNYNIVDINKIIKIQKAKKARNNILRKRSTLGLKNIKMTRS